MRTVRRPISPEHHRAACGFVLGLLPRLDWRHNGLGMLQAYAHEDATDELRVHIWHPSLRRPGIEESGLLHDHRFDLRSTVLVGALRQVEYNLTPAEDGEWHLHSVVPARKALAASGGVPNGLVEALPGRYRAATEQLEIYSGEVYDFPKFVFHGTRTLTDLVVTVVEKSAQEEAQAKILAPYDKPVVHAFANPYPRETWLPVIEEAREELLRAWRRKT